MAKYTTELRSICESLAQSDLYGEAKMTGYSGMAAATAIATARPLIFNFDYPLDDDYKTDFETLFLQKYYTREICAETYGRWKLFLQTDLQLKMPYYNELLKSNKLTYDVAMNDIDTWDHNEHQDNQSGNTNGTSTDSGTDTNTRTPNLTDTDTHGETITMKRGAQEEVTNNIANNKSTVTPTGTERTYHHGNTWEKYSDTPQSGMNNFATASGDTTEYLTNVTLTQPETYDDVSYENERKTVTKNESNGTSAVHFNKSTQNLAGDVDHTQRANYEDSDEHSGSDTHEHTGNEINTTDYGKTNTHQDNSSSNSNGTSNTHRIGRAGGRSAAQLLKEYRDSILNIYQMAIDDFNDLFMQVW